MRYAKSARAIMSLGATLVAMASAASAADMNSTVERFGSSGTFGIDAGDALGIDAGDALGIDAGGIVLSGPVDSIDTVNGVFKSMGQVVMASHDMLSGMSVGDLVSVEGSVVAAGWLYADGVSVSQDLYVPGATEVLVMGILSSVDLATGTAQIGGLTIDYTASLGSADAPTGAIWSFGGTRPTSSGAMLSERSSAP